MANTTPDTTVAASAGTPLAIEGDSALLLTSLLERLDVALSDDGRLL